MSTISASTTTTTAYKVAADTTGTLVLQTGATPTTAVTIDGSQNVGVGVTPSAWYTGSSWKVIDLPSAALRGGSQGAALYANAYVNSGLSNIYKNTGFYALAYQQQADTGAHGWFNAPSGTAGNAITFTQAMTLNASANLLLGTTSPINAVSRIASHVAAGNIGLETNANGDYYPAIFYKNGTTTGYIQISGSTTSYGTASDYRLKNSVAPMTGALAKVAALKPVTYKWNIDDAYGEGFIAHELAEVCPQAVSGEKDAVDVDGNPVYQGIDTSFLVATLTAAIKEQQTIITQLQADVAALKGAA